MNCQANDCPNKAAGAIAIQVPARGCPIPEHEPLKMIVRLCLCAEHLEREKGRVQEWLALPGYRKLFEATARGYADPDFERAFIEKVEFGDEDWKQLQLSRRK